MSHHLLGNDPPIMMVIYKTEPFTGLHLILHLDTTSANTSDMRIKSWTI